MSYTIDIDPAAVEQIRALPAEAVKYLAEAFEVLTLVPDRGTPLHPRNPEGLRHLVFGEGAGMITYLLLRDLDRVDVLLVTWVSLNI